MRLRTITGLLLEQNQQRLKARRITLRLDKGAIHWIVDRSYQPEFGARPLRRVIGRQANRKLSRLPLAGELDDSSEYRRQRR